VLGSIGAGLLYHFLFERHAINALRKWILARATSDGTIAARPAQ
jgi:hypothetical protein